MYECILSLAVCECGSNTLTIEANEYFIVTARHIDKRYWDAHEHRFRTNSWFGNNIIMHAFRRIIIIIILLSFSVSKYLTITHSWTLLHVPRSWFLLLLVSLSIHKMWGISIIKMWQNVFNSILHGVVSSGICLKEKTLNFILNVVFTYLVNCHVVRCGNCLHNGVLETIFDCNLLQLYAMTHCRSTAGKIESVGMILTLLFVAELVRKFWTV